MLLGLCIEDVQTELRLSLEEFAHALGKDERQVKRWQTAEERPQVEAVFAIERFQVALIVAMAKRIGNAVEVETVIRVRRSA